MRLWLRLIAYTTLLQLVALFRGEWVTTYEVAIFVAVLYLIEQQRRDVRFMLAGIITIYKVLEGQEKETKTNES